MAAVAPEEPDEEEDNVIQQRPQKKITVKQLLKFLVALVVFFYVLYRLFFRRVPLGEFAMKFSHWSQDVHGDPITEPGINWVGLFNGIVRWPSVQQMLYFDDFGDWEPGVGEISRPKLSARTRDGLKIELKVSIQWSLEVDKLLGLYRILGGAEDLLEQEPIPGKPGYAEAMTRYSWNTLGEVCADFTARDIFENVTKVQESMLGAMQVGLSGEGNMSISVAEVHLRTVELPSAYSSAIAETKKEEQDYFTAAAERATKSLQRERTVMLSRKKQEELKLQALATAEQTRISSAAYVRQYTSFQKEHVDAYSRIAAATCNNITQADPWDAFFELMEQGACKKHSTDHLSMAT